MPSEFQKTIYEYFQQHGRSFPWRETTDPYAILVSEIMLQQTQTDRVVPKYLAWLSQFPDPQHLAAASTAEVLKYWQGLGYNRRALALKRCAEAIVATYGGRVPENLDELVSLPGIGPYTAGAVLAFAFNRPQVFIETNIRSVYIHFFFKDIEGVTDKQLVALIEQTLDRTQPRMWYQALMDYGAMLKKTQPNPSRKSRHYTKQSAFKDSDRRIRGLILKFLLNGQQKTVGDIEQALAENKTRIERILKGLVTEGFLIQENENYSIKKD